MKGHERLESRLFVHGTVVFAENPVQQQRDRVCDRVHHVHQAEHEGAEKGADLEAVAHAHGLRDDLAKYHDQHGTGHDGLPATSQATVEDNRQRFVRNDIRQQQGDQEPMLALRDEVQDAAGELLFTRGAGAADDFEVYFVLAHKPQREPCENPAQQHQ